MGGTFQTILAGGIVAAITAILGFVLYRSEKAATTANTAMTTLGGAVRLTGALRQANDRQADRITEWKEFGGQVADVEDQNLDRWKVGRAAVRAAGGDDIGELVLNPKPPPNVLELADLFKDL